MADAAPSIAQTAYWQVRPHDVIDVNGHRCHVLDRGAGQPILVLHGLGSLAREMALPLRPLRKRYRLIIPDRPGYGASDSLHRFDPAADLQVDWLTVLMRRMRITRPIIAAHSIGAAVALRYALRFPRDVAGLLLIAPFCRPGPPAAAALLRLAILPLIGRWMRDRLTPSIVARTGPHRLKLAFRPNPIPDAFRSLPFRDLASPRAVLAMASELLGFNAAMEREHNGLPDLHVPTVVIAGDADRIANPDQHAAWLADRIPHSHLIRLPGVGHMPQHAMPAVVLRAIDDLAGTALSRNCEWPVRVAGSL